MADDKSSPAREPESVADLGREWHDLKVKVAELETGRAALEQETKALRSLLERVIEHRQKSHGELVLLLASLVGKLPINDVGVIVTRLVEHNTHVSEILATLGKGQAGAELPPPTSVQALDQARQELASAVKQAVEELVKSGAPLEADMLRSLAGTPELFFSPPVVRACRCYIKGQLPRERIVRQFGETALALFNDMTTDPKLNPRPKPEEVSLAFKPDAETLMPQQSALSMEQREQLLALNEKVQHSRAGTEEARAQKDAFTRLSFLLDLRHYYNNQSTEPADVVFAQRLPALIEQLVLASNRKVIEEQAVIRAENLLALVLNSEHRLMIVNNVGKGGGLGRTLKYMLRLRMEEVADLDQVVMDLVRHLLPAPPAKPQSPPALAALLRLIPAERQRRVALAIRSSDRIPRGQAQALAKALAEELGLGVIEEKPRPAAAVTPEEERKNAWDEVRALMKRRAAAANIATAIRNRLHAKYDAEELKESWVVLTEADPIMLIRVICQLPYRDDGKTDPIAHTVLQTYVSRLTHEKYAAVHQKVVTSLRNMFKAKPDSPTLRNFLALIKWVDPNAETRLVNEIGMAIRAVPRRQENIRT